MADILSLLGSDGGNDMRSEIIHENLEQRVLVFNDIVDENVVENYILYILKWNKEDKDLPVDKRQEITIYINSAGGSSMDGFSLVDIIEQSKTPIKGVCLGLAASMGYHILLSCHKRYAFKNSILLQHDGEIAIQNSTSKARDTMRFFDDMERRTKEYVLSHTQMSEDFYDKVYEQEYWMYADEAKALGCIDYIIGTDVNLDDVI